MGAWKTGDLVYLKSGSPRMTVATATDYAVSCVWFENSTMKEHSFAPAMLESEAAVEARVEEESRRIRALNDEYGRGLV